MYLHGKDDDGTWFLAHLSALLVPDEAKAGIDYDKGSSDGPSGTFWVTVEFLPDSTEDSHRIETEDDK